MSWLISCKLKVEFEIDQMGMVRKEREIALKDAELALAESLRDLSNRCSYLFLIKQEGLKAKWVKD